MQKQYFLAILILASLLTSCAGHQANKKSIEDYRMPTIVPAAPALTATAALAIPSASCPVTAPQNPPFVPPAPYDSKDFEGEFWYGSHALWTSVQQNGTWRDLPHNPEGYTQKVFWWRDGYSWTGEPEPALVVTGER